jgi:hypothetical protein
MAYAKQTYKRRNNKPIRKLKICKIYAKIVK